MKIKKLFELYKANGISQVDISKMTGRSVQVISNDANSGREVLELKDGRFIMERKNSVIYPALEKEDETN